MFEFAEPNPAFAQRNSDKMVWVVLSREQVRNDGVCSIVARKFENLAPILSRKQLQNWICGVEITS